MSLCPGFDWSYKDLHFKGYSIAGQCTSLVFNNPKICFDIGPGLPFHLGAKLYCITHLHSDHGAGLNYLLAQRSLFRLPPANIMLPKRHLESVNQILQTWMQIEEFDYSYNLIPVSHNTTYDHGERYQVRAFTTPHRISSHGYIVYEKKKRRDPQFAHASPDELKQARAKGLQIEQLEWKPLVAFTGDTKIEFLDSHPDVKRASLLFLEATYLDEKKSREETRHWGHTHFDEILEKRNQFQNEQLCLIHLSARYKTKEALEILKKKWPTEENLPLLTLFPRPY